MNSLLPILISAYQSTQKTGAGASAAESKKMMANFSALLQASMMQSLTSAFGSSDDKNSDSSGVMGASNSLSSLLSGLNGSSSSSGDLLSSLLSGGGSLDSSSDSASLLSSLLGGSSSSSNSGLLASLLSSGGLGNSSDSASLLSSLLGGQSSTSSISSLLGNSQSSSSLYEQMLAQQIQNEYLASQSSSHINQFSADLAAGGDGSNADCGPASLVMALHDLGLRVAGETVTTSDSQSVDLARLSMAGDPSKDGLDANGLRSESEHSINTDFNDLIRGATAAGAKSATVNANASSIMHALQEGAVVIASGTFENKTPLPWTGDMGVDNQIAPGGATNHIIEISAYDSFSKLFTINDPARSSTLQVSAATLENFMAGNAGALAVWR